MPETFCALQCRSVPRRRGPRLLRWLYAVWEGKAAADSPGRAAGEAPLPTHQELSLLLAQLPGRLLDLPANQKIFLKIEGKYQGKTISSFSITTMIFRERERERERDREREKTHRWNVWNFWMSYFWHRQEQFHEIFYSYYFCLKRSICPLYKHSKMVCKLVYFESPIPNNRQFSQACALQFLFSKKLQGH